MWVGLSWKNSNCRVRRYFGLMGGREQAVVSALELPYDEMILTVTNCEPADAGSKTSSRAPACPLRHYQGVLVDRIKAR